MASGLPHRQSLAYALALLASQASVALGSWASALVIQESMDFYRSSHIVITTFRIPSAVDEKLLRWVGAELADFRSGPSEVRDGPGAAPSAVQFGGTAESSKAWKGSGPGDFEGVKDFRTDPYRADTYRAVHTVRFEQSAHVLHAFRKKSPRGTETDRRDIDMVERTLQSARKIAAGALGSNANPKS